MKLPTIPTEYLIGILMIGLIVMRCFGIDTFTETAMGMIIGYLTGKHIEQRNRGLCK